MRILAASLAIAITAVPSLAPAQTDPAVPATGKPAKTKKPVDPTKKTCRREAVTGSIMGSSVCHTPADWAEIDRANALQVDALRNHPTSNQH